MSAPNIILLLFDILCFPILIIRLIIIYFYGAKYNIKGFKFLDVIMHADGKYFNQDNENTINTECKDYRCVVRDDSRLCPVDVKKYLIIHNKQIINEQHVNEQPSNETANEQTNSETESCDDDTNKNNSPYTILDSIRNELKDCIFY